MEFFHLVKASQKSGKPNIVFWFTAKTEARAKLQAQVILEDNGIEVGRGQDYQLPVLTNFPVVDDLPEEEAIDSTWCERYALSDDNRTWLPIVKVTEPQPEAKSKKADLLRPVSRLRLPQRIITHLINDTEHKEITEEQHIQIGQIESEGGDEYVRNLLLAVSNIPEAKELSAHAEWRLIKAIKKSFSREESFTVPAFEDFITKWIEVQNNAEGACAKTDASSEAEKNATAQVEDSCARDMPVLIGVPTLPFRQRVIALFLFGKKGDTYYIDADQKKDVLLAEMDTDNSYVQNLVLAAESEPSLKNLKDNDLWRLIDAVKSVFPADAKAPELGTLCHFIKTFLNTAYIDRGILVSQWKSGNRVTVVQHAESELASTLATEDNGARKVEFMDDESAEFQLITMPFQVQFLAQLCSEKDCVYHISIPHRKELLALEADMDNDYVQNFLMALESAPEVKTYDIPELWKLTDSAKKALPQLQDHQPSKVLRFIEAWVNTASTDRDLLVKEWEKGNFVTKIQRTDSGTNAGGGNKTDRNPDYTHTLDTLDIEIALALLPPDFDIYSIPGSACRRAKEIIANKESPFKEWSAALRRCPGILDFSRAAIFALIRSADEKIYLSSPELHAYISAGLTEYQHDKPSADTVAAAQLTRESRDRILAISRGEDVKDIGGSTEQPQPKIQKIAAGVFSIDGLMGDSTTTTQGTAGNEQMEETVQIENKTDTTLSASESTDAVGSQTDSVNNVVCMSCSAIGGGHCPDYGSVVGDATYAAMEADLPDEVATTSDSVTNDEVQTESAQEPAWPEYFEPGRYEGVPNEVYHAANGISSTQVKDARVSLMYFNARHVEKTIKKERSAVLDMGNLVHALALQPESLDKEFSVEPVTPEGAFTTTATIRAAIDEYNAGLPQLLSADDIKALIEEHNASLVPPLSGDEIKALLEAHNDTLPPQISLGSPAESYMALPPEYQRLEDGQKQAFAVMKACIKEYNATLPARIKTSGSRENLLELLATINPDLVEFESQKPVPLKTSGSRDALLEQLAIINPDLVAQEAQKAQPLKVSGTKTDLIQSLKAVNPDAVFADELLDAWRENPEGKVLVTRQQLSTALAIQKALLDHPTAGKLLTHPSRAVEVSYFGIDEETGLEVRVRPDLEIDMGARIGADLKTISMWNIKQEGLRARLHREIIDRDYHLSAAMYCETAALDQFFWIFVNKDENYHWIAIIEASTELLELGMLEYRSAMKNIANGFDTGEWPAPINNDYTDELNDFDMRRLEALREQA